MKVTKKLVTEITESLCGPNSPLSDQIDWGMAAITHQIVGYALEAAKSEWEDDTRIVSVRAQTCGNHDPIVGYATGKTHDIEAYFDNVKQYGLTIEAIKVVEVPSGYKAHRDNIVAKRDRLQAELDELNKRLENGDLDK